MPLYLEPRDVAAELEAFRSVLIVPCPICPPMSLAMQKKQPFIDLFKHGLNPPAFEEYIRSVRAPLEERGIRTDVFNLRLQCPLMCLWTQGQRDRLRREAKDYEAVLVLGCNSATSTVEETLKDTDCRVIQAMRMKALANATAKVRYPLKIELDMHPLQKIRRVRPRGEAEERPKQNSSKAS